MRSTVLVRSRKAGDCFLHISHFLSFFVVWYDIFLQNDFFFYAFPSRPRLLVLLFISNFFSMFFRRASKASYHKNPPDNNMSVQYLTAVLVADK